MGNLDKDEEVSERQPCRLPEGTTGVDSVALVPNSFLGEQSNVPLGALGSSSNESEGSLEISVPLPVKKLGGNKLKGKVRFAPTSVVKMFVGDVAVGEGSPFGESKFPTVPKHNSKQKQSPLCFLQQCVFLWSSCPEFRLHRQI